MNILQIQDVQPLFLHPLQSAQDLRTHTHTQRATVFARLFHGFCQSMSTSPDSRKTDTVIFLHQNLQGSLYGGTYLSVGGRRWKEAALFSKNGPISFHLLLSVEAVRVYR